MAESDIESPRGHKSLREAIQFYLIDSKTRLGKYIDMSIIFLNLVVVVIFIITTFPVAAEGTQFRGVIDLIEDVIVGFFIIEYAFRLYGARNRIKHIYNVYSIIDFVAILPTLISPFIGSGHINLLKLLRMFRVFRILRFLRFFDDEEFFFGRISSEMLKVFRLGMTVFMIFFVASGLFYLTESGDVNPSVNNFGDAFYFTVVALTTVGFGDITPMSGAGKTVTLICILSGIILIPWQIGEIVREWIHLSHKTAVICKSCGLQYHDKDAVHCKACGHNIYQEYDI